MIIYTSGTTSRPKGVPLTHKNLLTSLGNIKSTYALTPDDVFGATAAGEVMPQKSTFFYPKLPTGLVFRPLGSGSDSGPDRASDAG